nr:vegetative cell wall protein gp1-like [Aegilops tauschii subsp. strangulata]
MVLWCQGTRPPGVTYHAGRPREKKEAAKRSPGCKKMLLRSQRHRDKTACRLRWRRVDNRGRLRISKGPRWPQQAAAPSLRSCEASSGRGREPSSQAGPSASCPSIPPNPSPIPSQHLFLSLPCPPPHPHAAPIPSLDPLATPAFPAGAVASFQQARPPASTTTTRSSAAPGSGHPRVSPRAAAVVIHASRSIAPSSHGSPSPSTRPCAKSCCRAPPSPPRSPPPWLHLHHHTRVATRATTKLASCFDVVALQRVLPCRREASPETALPCLCAAPPLVLPRPPSASSPWPSRASSRCALVPFPSYPCSSSGPAVQPCRALKRLASPLPPRHPAASRLPSPWVFHQVRLQHKDMYNYA